MDYVVLAFDRNAIGYIAITGLSKVLSGSKYMNEDIIAL